jgi:hypothetical protein
VVNDEIEELRVIWERETLYGLPSEEVKEAKKAALAAYWGRIEREIKSLLARRKLGVETKILIGGLSELLKGQVKDYLTFEQGEFINALGGVVKYPRHLIIDFGFGDIKVAKPLLV